MASISEVKVKIAGIAPVLMHNGQLGDPLNPFSKAIAEVSAKRKKSDKDHEEMSRREFLGSLYFSDEIGVYLPGEMIEGALRDGGRLDKLGKAIIGGVQCLDDEIPLSYKGPKDPGELFKDPNFVDRRGVKLNGKTRIMRTRPRFKEWSAEFRLRVLTEQVNLRNVEKALRSGGTVCGLGDYRPKFGRFEVLSFEEV